MLEDKARFEFASMEISKDTSKNSVHRGASFNLNGKWIRSEDDLPPNDPDTLVVKYLDISVRFFIGRKGMQAKEPYCVYSYLFDEGRCRCKDWNDLLDKSQADDKQGKVIRFLLKYTNLSAEIFMLAYVNLGFLVPVGFDTLRYAQDVAGSAWLSEPVFGAPCQMDQEQLYYAIHEMGYLKRKAEKEEMRRKAKKQREENSK